MTTYIEILDTAVKIGLGAAITGIATYWVTKLKGDQAFNHEAVRANRAVIEKMSLRVEESANMLTKVIMVLHRASESDVKDRAESIDEAKKIYLYVYEHINHAEALATLVGSRSTRQKLKEYADITSKFYDIIRFNQHDFDGMDDVIESINVIREDLHEFIRADFENLNS